MYAVPSSDWLLVTVFFAGLIALVATAEWLTRRRGWPAESARKSVHLLTGLLVLPTPYLFHSPVPLWLLAALFVAINVLTLSGRHLSTLAAGRERSLGTVFFPTVYAVLLWIFWNEKPALVVAMAALGVADMIAAAVGRSVAKPHRIQISPEAKSVEGSAAMFSATAVLTFFGLLLLPDSPSLPFAVLLWAALSIGLCATAAEVVSYRGSDNLTVPLVAAFVASLFLRYPAVDIGAFSLGLALAFGLAVVSPPLGFLDAGGAVAMFLMGTLIFGLGGWSFAVPIAAFFVASSLLSHLGKKGKQPLREVFEKSGRRDLSQVVANGAVPTIFTLAWYIDPQPLWYLLFLASVAAITADTWATEIGVLSPQQPRSIVSGKRVARGTSGGVTLLGLAGAAAGAGGIAAIGSIVPAGGSITGRVAVGIGISGLVAHLVDSVLGATLQAQYLCSHCGKVSEKQLHCGRSGRLVGGIAGVTNDLVNAACAMSGAFALLLSRPLLRWSAFSR